jgi:opacity protein-like surface antigen
MLKLGVFLLFVAGTATAVAQSGFSIGPEIGVHKSKDADDAKVLGGASARLSLMQGLGVEGSVQYREETYGYTTVKSWPLMVTGLVYPFPVAYGAIGAGWYNVTSVDNAYPPGYTGPGISSTETTQKFGWHFGGGVEIPIQHMGRIVGDVRYVFLDYDFKTFPGTNGLNYDFYVIKAGLMFDL